jgi:hypothetical protein
LCELLVSFYRHLISHSTCSKTHITNHQPTTWLSSSSSVLTTPTTSLFDPSHHPTSHHVSPNNPNNHSCNNNRDLALRRLVRSPPRRPTHHCKYASLEQCDASPSILSPDFRRSSPACPLRIDRRPRWLVPDRRRFLVRCWVWAAWC